MDEITLRRATVDDAALITHQRRRMFEDMGVQDFPALDRMDREFLPWVTERLADERYLGWLACTADGTVVGGSGLIFYDWIPGYLTEQHQRPYILNVYVHPDFRRRGIAPRMVTAICDYCRAQGWTHIWLHASEQGYPIYESLGFARTREMLFKLSE